MVLLIRRVSDGHDVVRGFSQIQSVDQSQTRLTCSSVTERRFISKEVVDEIEELIRNKLTDKEIADKSDVSTYVISLIRARLDVEKIITDPQIRLIVTAPTLSKQLSLLRSLFKKNKLPLNRESIILVDNATIDAMYIIGSRPVLLRLRLLLRFLLYGVTPRYVRHIEQIAETGDENLSLHVDGCKLCSRKNIIPVRYSIFRLVRFNRRRHVSRNT